MVLLGVSEAPACPGDRWPGEVCRAGCCAACRTRSSVERPLAFGGSASEGGPEERTPGPPGLRGFTAMDISSSCCSNGDRSAMGSSKAFAERVVAGDGVAGGIAGLPLQGMLGGLPPTLLASSTGRPDRPPRRATATAPGPMPSGPPAAALRMPMGAAPPARVGAEQPPRGTRSAGPAVLGDDNEMPAGDAPAPRTEGEARRGGPGRSVAEGLCGVGARGAGRRSMAARPSPEGLL